MKPTASPAARNRATASAAPGQRLVAEPQHTVEIEDDRPAARSMFGIGARFRPPRSLPEGVLVGLLLRPHDRGDLEVPPGAARSPVRRRHIPSPKWA